MSWSWIWNYKRAVRPTGAFILTSLSIGRHLSTSLDVALQRWATSQRQDLALLCIGWNRSVILLKLKLFQHFSVTTQQWLIKSAHGRLTFDLSMCKTSVNTALAANNLSAATVSSIQYDFPMSTTWNIPLMPELLIISARKHPAMITAHC